MKPAASTSVTGPRMGSAHARRLRALWRSAGWPSHDVIEAELLVAGMPDRVYDDAGRHSLRVTDAGLRLIVDSVQRHRTARDRHEALVERVARKMQRAGRLVWRGLALRVPSAATEAASAWTLAMPDVFSIRNTTVEDYVEPTAHEIKVRRADLLSDLRHEGKREAYRTMSSQCWYVIAAGIGQPEEIPPQYGVMLAQGDTLEVARPAPRRALRLPFTTWMALARSAAQGPLDDEALGGLQASTIDAELPPIGTQR